MVFFTIFGAGCAGYLAWQCHWEMLYIWAHIATPPGMMISILAHWRKLQKDEELRHWVGPNIKFKFSWALYVWLTLGFIVGVVLVVKFVERAYIIATVYNIVLSVINIFRDFEKDGDIVFGTTWR
jgi:hypothetical protein